MNNPDRASNLAPRFAYDDLRQWLDEARNLGEVKDVSGLSWQRDIGMVAGVAMHDDGAPCFVFGEVPGTIEGSRVLVNFFGGRRKNMTLGFPTDLGRIELSEGFRSHFMAPMKRVAPRYVKDGPILENAMRGDDVDIGRFPAPKWHEPDGGRYIGTGSFNVIRDPDEGWINCGTYRVMIHDARTAGFYISPGKHGRQMRDKYRARGEAMPVAVVCGGDPMTFLMACSEVPYGVCEYEIVGGMRGRPVDVIKAPVTGLPIPANAEICWKASLRPTMNASRGRSANGPAIMRATCGPSPCSTSRPSTIATTPSSWAARHSVRPTRSAAIAPWSARRYCARTSRKLAFRASPPPGRMRSATRGCFSRSPSISAIPAIPSRPAISRPCAMSAPIAGAT